MKRPKRWPKRHRITFLLKNGVRVSFKVQKYEIQRGANNEFRGYTFEGAKGKVPLWIDIDNVDSVIVG